MKTLNITQRIFILLLKATAILMIGCAIIAPFLEQNSHLFNR